MEKENKKLIITQKGLSSSVVEFTPLELSCLLDMVEQDMEDNDECIEELHKETLRDIYSKLVILNK